GTYRPPAQRPFGSPRRTGPNRRSPLPLLRVIRDSHVLLGLHSLQNLGIFRRSSRFAGIFPIAGDMHFLDKAVEAAALCELQHVEIETQVFLVKQIAAQRYFPITLWHYAPSAS